MVYSKDGQSAGLDRALTDTEAALRQALLDTLVNYPRQMHDSEEELADTAWDYLQAADCAHPAVSAVLREAAAKLVE